MSYYPLSTLGSYVIIPDVNPSSRTRRKGARRSSWPKQTNRVPNCEFHNPTNHVRTGLPQTNVYDNLDEVSIQ